MDNKQIITSIKSMLPFLLVVVLGFYLLPLMIVDTGSGFTVLLILLPMLCFICSFIYGAIHSFHILFVVFVAILFVPVIFIYLNSTAWVFVIIYGVIALFGSLLGIPIHKIVSKKKA